MNEITTIQPKQVELVSDSILVDFLKFTGNAGKLTEQETKHFISLAKAFNLNPLKREIHISVYGEGQNRQLSIVTGYEVYIKRAERTGLLDGWDVTTEGAGENLLAVITIYRKDRSRPFTHEVHYSEYVQRKKDGSINKFWKEKPVTMLKKVAISQGFRLCFCDDLDGMPYTSDEMPQIEEREVNSVAGEPAAVIPEQTEEIDHKKLNDLALRIKPMLENIEFEKLEKLLVNWKKGFDEQKINEATYLKGKDTLDIVLNLPKTNVREFERLVEVRRSKSNLEILRQELIALKESGKWSDENEIIKSIYFSINGTANE